MNDANIKHKELEDQARQNIQSFSNNSEVNKRIKQQVLYLGLELLGVTILLGFRQRHYGCSGLGGYN